VNQRQEAIQEMIISNLKEKASQEKLLESKTVTRVEEYRLEATQQKPHNHLGYLEISRKEQVSDRRTIRLSESSKQVSQAEVEFNNPGEDVKVQLDSVIHKQNLKEEKKEQVSDKMLLLEVIFILMFRLERQERVWVW